MPTTPIVPPSSPSSTSSTSSPSHSPAIAIAISAAGAVLLLVSIMALTFHFRRQNKKKISVAQARAGRELQAGETVSRAHPAALMITPAEGNGTPRFVHTPGTNMRIATRRPDGAWEFADPRAPFTPAIIADAADASLLASRNSSSATSTSSDLRGPSPSRGGSTYSHARYGSEVAGRSSEFLPPSTVASPWGAPTPRTAESARSPGRVHSPAPSTPASRLSYTNSILPAPSASGSSRRSSIVSSKDSFLDLEPSSNPFLSPAPSATTSRSARWPASPLSSPAPSAPASPELPAARPRQVESRAARAIRLGYEELDRISAYAEQSGQSSTAPASSPGPLMTPAARAKEMESRAEREMRRGYESVERHSEYAEQDEGLPSY